MQTMRVVFPAAGYAFFFWENMPTDFTPVTVFVQLTA
jgi:hypothetical protein